MTSSGSVFAALRIEARAVRTGWPDADVATIGMRARRLQQLERLGRLDLDRAANGPVRLLGFGGGLDARQQPGDVVVATEIRSAAGSVELPAAAEILGVLRRAGIAASAGPLWSSDHIVRGTERKRLAGAALVIDMESAAVVAACGADRLVVVRVVVDTPQRGLLRASITGGLRARRVLVDVAAALAAHHGVEGHQPITSGTVEVAIHGTTALTTEEG